MHKARPWRVGVNEFELFSKLEIVMSIFPTLMPYIKERKKGNASKFQIALIFMGRTS